MPAASHDLARSAVDLGNHHQRLVETPRPQRHDEQILDVDAPPRVRAATEYLDLRQRQPHRPAGGEIAPQRFTGRMRSRMRHGHRNGDGRVAAQPGQVRRSVERNERRVDPRLIPGVHAANRRRDLAIHVRHGTAHPQAAEQVAAIAQVDRLVTAARCSRRCDGAATRAAGQHDFGLDGRPAA